MKCVIPLVSLRVHIVLHCYAEGHTDSILVGLNDKNEMCVMRFNAQSPKSMGQVLHILIDFSFLIFTLFDLFKY